MLGSRERGDVGRALLDDALAHCTFASFCRGGMPVFVRPLRPSDRELDPDFIASLAQSLRLIRGFTAAPMGLDDDRRVALVATTRTNDGTEQIVGVAGYAMTGRPHTAAIAVTVKDTWQNRGIATLLLESLLQCARRQSLCKLTGLVPANNAPMLRLAKRVGFSVRREGDDQVYRIEKRLADPRTDPADTAA